MQSVAAAYGVNERSVFHWLADFISGGQSALLAKPIPGRPSKLSAEELSWIANAVRDHNPQQFKFEFGLWTLSLIRHLIKRQSYSPHLNPDEMVWVHVKRKVSRQLVESAEEMKRLALGALRSIQKPPELVKSFFRQPECRHILG